MCYLSLPPTRLHFMSDFFEFMVLIYKIQRGTANELAQILTEAKSQLAIFEVLTDYAVHISYVVTSFVTAMLFLASPLEATI